MESDMSDTLNMSTIIPSPAHPNSNSQRLRCACVIEASLTAWNRGRVIVVMYLDRLHLLANLGHNHKTRRWLGSNGFNRRSAREGS